MMMAMQDDDDAIAQLHILSWPLGQIRQKQNLKLHDHITNITNL